MTAILSFILSPIGRYVAGAAAVLAIIASLYGCGAYNERQRAAEINAEAVAKAHTQRDKINRSVNDLDKRGLCLRFGLVWDDAKKECI